MTESHHDITGENSHSLGAIFRNTRSAKHISIEDVVGSTRIHTRFIEALEADNYKNMPAEIFVRGFIKLYAEFLGIPPDQALEMYQQQLSANPQDFNQTPYRQNTLIDKKYADPEAYRKRKKKLSLLIISLTLLATLLFIASQLPKLARKLNPVNPNKTLLQESLSGISPDLAEAPAPPSNEPTVVDRPPSITIDETHDPELQNTGQRKKPADSAGILDRSLYENTKSNDYPDILTTADSTTVTQVMQTSDSITQEPTAGKTMPARDQDRPAYHSSQTQIIGEDNQSQRSPETSAETETNHQKVKSVAPPMTSVGVKTIPVGSEESISSGLTTTQTENAMKQLESTNQEIPEPAESTASKSPSFTESAPTGNSALSSDKNEETQDTSPIRFQPVTVKVSTAKTQSETAPQNSLPSENIRP